MKNGAQKPISRRRFLAYSAAALAAQACASASRSAGLFPRPEKEYEPQFYVASPRYYLNLDQDFSKVRYDKVLKAPGDGFPPLNRTHLSVIGSRSRRIRYVSLPGLVHSVLADRGRAFMVPTDGQRWLYAIDGDSLEIDAFVRGAVDGSWADYQLSALLMAIVWRGMTPQETAHYTEAMMRSGIVADLSAVKRPNRGRASVRATCRAP